MSPRCSSVTARRRTRTALAISVLALLASIPAAHAATGIHAMRGAEQLRGSTGAGHLPVVAQSNAGATIAWEETGKGIRVSDFRKRSWLRQVQPRGGTKGGEFPALAVSANGHAVLAWVAKEGANAGRIAVSYRPPGAADFGTPTYYGDVQGGSVSYVTPTVAINASGRSVVAWSRYGDDYSVEVAYGARSKFGGASSLAMRAATPRVAVDDAGRAVLLHLQWNDDVTFLQQYLAPAGGTFGTAMTIDAKTGGSGASDEGLDLAGNRAGQIAAVWADVCDDCPQVFMSSFGTGTTAGGITSQRAYTDMDKQAVTSKVAIDETGFAAAAIDGIGGLGVVHATPEGYFAPVATYLAELNGVVDPEVNVQVVNGDVVVTWAHADAAGQPTGIFARETSEPAAGAPGSWSDTDRLTPAGRSADSHRVAARPGNVVLTYRANGKIWADTNARRDTSKPSMTLPKRRAGLRVAGNAFKVRMTCVKREASCEGTLKATTRVRKGKRMRTVTIGSASFYVLGGTSIATKLKLNKTGRAMAKRGKPAITTTLKVTVRDAARNRKVLSRSVRVLPPRR